MRGASRLFVGRPRLFILIRSYLSSVRTSYSSLRTRPRPSPVQRGSRPPLATQERPAEGYPLYEAEATSGWR